MANITNKTTDTNGNIIYNINIGESDSISLATAGTYSDKNIVFNTSVDLSAKQDALTSGVGINISDDNEISVNIEANPENIATTSLTKLKIDDTIYNISTDSTVVTFTVGSTISTEISGLTAYSLTADKDLSDLLTEISNGNKVYGKLTQSGSTMSIGEGFPEVLTQSELLFETAIKYSINSSAIEEIRAAVDFTSEGAILYIYQKSGSGSGGTVDLTSEAIISALGYTPYDAANPQNYKATISSTDITNALGYTPYNNTNPSNYVTKSVNSLTNYYTKSEVNDLLSNDLVYLVVTELPTSGISTNTVYLMKDEEYYDQYMYINKEWIKIGTTKIDLSDYALKTNLADVATTGDYSDLINKPALAAVATTGSYNDLLDTPTIPTNISAFTNDSNYVKNNDLSSVNVSTFINDVPYAKMSDITALEDLDVDAIQKAIDATQNIGTVTRVTGGTGLIGDGTTTVTINHKNSVTGVGSYPLGTTTANGGTFTVRDVQYDSTGHITASQDRVITLPTITEYDDTEVRRLISNETSARTTTDDNLQTKITNLNTDLTSAVSSIDTTTSGLDTRITAIENATCVVYISDAAPTSDIGEDGDIYIQS